MAVLAIRRDCSFLAPSTAAAQLTPGRNRHISQRGGRRRSARAALTTGLVKRMASKRFLQMIGVSLLIATVGIVSCQALFANTSGLGATQSSAERLRR
jgi:hypothetical protein